MLLSPAADTAWPTWFLFAVSSLVPAVIAAVNRLHTVSPSLLNFSSR